MIHSGCVCVCAFGVSVLCLFIDIMNNCPLLSTRSCMRAAATIPVLCISLHLFLICASMSRGPEHHLGQYGLHVLLLLYCFFFTLFWLSVLVFYSPFAVCWHVDSWIIFSNEFRLAILHSFFP